MLDTFYHLIGRDTDPIAWWQMGIRTVIIFVWAMVLYRVVPRRAFGSNATIDIVLVVVLGSTLSRAITGNAPLLPVIGATALLAVLYSITILASARSDLVGRLVKGRSVRLIRNGELDEDVMRRAHIGEGDVRESLRLQGVAEVEHVAAAYLERNGEISVIRKT